MAIQGGLTHAAASMGSGCGVGGSRGGEGGTAATICQVFTLCQAPRKALPVYHFIDYQATHEVELPVSLFRLRTWVPEMLNTAPKMTQVLRVSPAFLSFHFFD